MQQDEEEQTPHPEMRAENWTFPAMALSRPLLTTFGIALAGQKRQNPAHYPNGEAGTEG